MTVAERAVYEGRIAQLEEALTEYMRVMELSAYRVTGDLRHDFLEAYGRCLVALPSYKRAPPLRRGGDG